MSDLTPEECEKIYAEEKARFEVRQELEGLKERKRAFSASLRLVDSDFWSSYLSSIASCQVREMLTSQHSVANNGTPNLRELRQSHEVVGVQNLQRAIGH